MNNLQKQPPAATPDHQYSSPHATTESERQLFKSIACACASVGLLYDDGLKEAIYGFVLPHQSRIERENAAQAAAIRSIVHDLTAIAERHSGTDIAVELTSLFKRANAILAAGKEP